MTSAGQRATERISASPCDDVEYRHAAAGGTHVDPSNSRRTLQQPLHVCVVGQIGYVIDFNSGTRFGLRKRAALSGGHVIHGAIDADAQRTAPAFAREIRI